MIGFLVSISRSSRNLRRPLVAASPCATILAARVRRQRAFCNSVSAFRRVPESDRPAMSWGNVYLPTGPGWCRRIRSWPASRPARQPSHVLGLRKPDREAPAPRSGRAAPNCPSASVFFIFPAIPTDDCPTMYRSSISTLSRLFLSKSFECGRWQPRGSQLATSRLPNAASGARGEYRNHW